MRGVAGHEQQREDDTAEHRLACDLKQDPFERKNLIHDASMRAVLEEMQATLAARMNEFGDVSEP
jgi:hypothetical protein